MRRQTAILCLTLAVLLGSAGVSWSVDYQKGLGAYRRGDYATAFREWKPLAEQGDSRAQFNLGWFYHFGKGVPQNVSTALKWYRRAAEQGNVNAQKNLKNMGKQVLSTSALPPCPKVGTRQHLNNCFGEFHSDRGKSWFGEFGQNGKLHGKGRHDGKNGIWNQGIFLGSKAQIYSLLTKQLSQIDTGKYVTYTGRTHANIESRPDAWGGYHRPNENFGPVTLTLMVDQNGNLTGLGDFTFTDKNLINPGPHTGPIMFSLCASWARSFSTPYTVSGTFQRATIPIQFQLGWGHTYSYRKSNMGSGSANCYGTGISSDSKLTSQQEKEKFDTNVLTGRMGSVFFTVTNAAYRENIRKEDQQKHLQILQKKKEQSKPENILKGRYIEYITVRECRNLGFYYISSKQFDAAKSSIKSINDYFKRTYRNMDTDTIWESANDEWDKGFGSLFTIAKATGGYNEELNGICKLSSMSLSFVKIPGAKKKRRKKDFE